MKMNIRKYNDLHRGVSFICHMALSVLVGTMVLPSLSRAEEVKSETAASCGIRFATGYSDGSDIFKAGVNAAQMAKQELKGHKAKLVYVTVMKPKEVKVGDLLNGVYEVFDKNIVYGSCQTGLWTTEAIRTTGMSVLAVSGDAFMSAAVAEGGSEAPANMGETIGKQLEKAHPPTNKNRLLLLTGNCYYPKHDMLVKGVLSVLGESLPIVGSGSHSPDVAYFRGTAYTNAAIGILFAGEFSCGFGIGTGTEPSVAILTAGKAAASATAVKGKPDLLLVFDCSGRLPPLRKNGKLEEEFAAVKKMAGDGFLFGGYGKGEFGKKEVTAPAGALAHSISCCAIYGSKD